MVRLTAPSPRPGTSCACRESLAWVALAAWTREVLVASRSALVRPLSTPSMSTLGLLTSAKVQFLWSRELIGGLLMESPRVALTVARLVREQGSRAAPRDAGADGVTRAAAPPGLAGADPEASLRPPPPVTQAAAASSSPVVSAPRLARFKLMSRIAFSRFGIRPPGIGPRPWWRARFKQPARVLSSVPALMPRRVRPWPPRPGPEIGPGRINDLYWWIDS